MNSTISEAGFTTLEDFAIRQGMTNDMVVSLLFNLGILTRIPLGGRAYPTAFAVRHSILRSDGAGSYLLTALGRETLSVLMAEKMADDTSAAARGQREPFVDRLAAAFQDHERLYGKDYLRVIDAPFIEETMTYLDNPDVADLYDVPDHSAALARWMKYPSLIDPRLAIAS
jgi:hypothetical protein